MVRIRAFQARGPGSIPGRCILKILLFYSRVSLIYIYIHTQKNIVYKSYAAIAQLGERQTEDLKVPGSIPGGGIIKYTHII